MINGYTAVALTKLDILDTFPEIWYFRMLQINGSGQKVSFFSSIGTEYLKNGNKLNHFPSSEQVRVFS